MLKEDKDKPLPSSYEALALMLLTKREEMEAYPKKSFFDMLDMMNKTIQEQLNADEEAERNYTLQNVISSILQISLIDNPLEIQLKRALEMVVSVPWFDILLKGAIYLINKDKTKLVLHTSVNMSSDTSQSCVEIITSQNNCWQEALKKKAVLIREKDACASEVSCKMSSHYSIPITSNFQPIGMIKIFVSQNHEPSEDAQDFFVTIANILAIMIDNNNSKVELEKYKDHLEDLVRDRTEELSISNKNLLSAIEKAEKANEMKRLFLANMSHEIRTPINGIIGMTTLLKAAQHTPEVTEKLSVIGTSAQSLLSIVNDILDFSKIEAGKLELEYIDFNLNEVINAMKEVFHFIVLDKNLSFSTMVDPDIPKYMIGDPNRLQQILTNLISNATKFTAKGGIKVRCLILNETEHNIEMRFEVQDTGLGIPEDKIDLIFESFQQADGSHTRKFGGTGLGLSICKKLIGMMGGKIWVNSEENKGSTFFFTTVFQKSAKTEQDIENENQDLGAEMLPLTILVVDDSIVNQKVAVGLLEMVGHKSDTANNGLEAVDKYKTGNYDLILMDIQMPEMDGLEATKAIRKLEKTSGKKQIPIVALTANAFKEDQEHYLSMGMNYYLSKPINFETLKAVLIKAAKYDGGALIEDNSKSTQESLLPVNKPIIENTKRIVTSDIDPNSIPLDFDKAVETFKGNKALVIELVEYLIQTVKEKIIAFEQGVLDKNFEEIKSNTHFIKGSAGNVYATPLSAVAATLEQAAKDNDMNTVLANRDKLKKEFERVETAYLKGEYS